MSVKDNNMYLFISDCLTGEQIVSLPIVRLKDDTIMSTLCDLYLDDKHDKHGFILKYGFKP